MNQHLNYYFRNKEEKSVLNNCRSSFLTKVTVYAIMVEIWKPSIKDLLLFLPSIASLHHPLAWTYLQLFHFQSNHVLQFLFQHHLSLQVAVSHRSLQELPLQPSKCCHLLRKNGIQWDGRGQNKDNARRNQIDLIELCVCVTVCIWYWLVLIKSTMTKLGRPWNWVIISILLRRKYPMSHSLQVSTLVWWD